MPANSFLIRSLANSFRRGKHPLTLLLILVAAAPGVGVAAWGPGNGLQVNQSPLSYDPATGAYALDASITNGNELPVSGALRIVVQNRFLKLDRRDGTTLRGFPYFVISNNELAPGETSDPVRIGLTRRLASGLTPRVNLGAQINRARFSMQLLHVSDIDGKGPLEDVRAFSALVDAFRADYPANTLTLTSGDNWIPGTEYRAAADGRMSSVLGLAGAGRAHVEFLNAMGFEASAMGNHDLDEGPEAFVSIVRPESDGVNQWEGADFPYLSTNLGFGADANTAIILTADGRQAADIAGLVAGTAIIEIAGETFGIVGATTPKLAQITNTGDIGILPEDGDDIDALVAIIQDAVDSLTAIGINKIILLAHMQQLSVEEILAGLLEDVDIIIGGGSNARLLDGDDKLYPGDQGFRGPYPFKETSPKGEPVLVVNTDGDYKYLGRLVAEFDALGRILPSSLNEATNGAYATDPSRLAELGLDAAADANPQVVAVADALQAVIDELAANAFGLTSVYLDGRREIVRTQESNMGNLTADANLWMARMADPNVQVSFKNGGGIRAPIGRIIFPPGSTDPEDATFEPPTDGIITQLDVQDSLRFDNGLTLLTVTAAELYELMGHGVAESSLDPSVQPGRFPQIGGMRFSWDPSLAAGTRVRSLAVVDDSGAVIERIVEDGAVVGDPDRTLRVVTLDFLADGGDGYPFPDRDRVDLKDSGLVPAGLFDFPAGGEQDALAEYLGTFFAEVGYDLPEVPPLGDLRNQNLGIAGKTDTVFDIPVGAINLTKIGGLDLGGAEIVTFDAVSAQAFVTGGSVSVVAIADPGAPVLLATLHPESDVAADVGGGFAAGSVTSTAYKNGLLAVAVPADPQTDQGYIAFYDEAGTYLGVHPAGALPDMVAWDQAGNRVLVANEGEDDDGLTAEGSVTVIDMPSTGTAQERVAAATPTQVSFVSFNGNEDSLRTTGVRIFPGATASFDFEPEYIAVGADDTKAYVALQENNALAVLDLTTVPYSIDPSLIPLGTKNHGMLKNALDASDRDNAINLQAWPVKGLYLPDGIATYDAGLGRTFVLTANEGDARNEDERVRNLTLDPNAFPDAATLQQDAVLGRLQVSTIDGDTDGDGDYDALFAYGARSFSIWDLGADPVALADSNDDIARVTAQQTPDLFNADAGDPAEVDARSDAKGAEPEAVIVGELGGRYYAFVGLERAGGGIMIYDITNPALPRFVSYTAGAPDDIALEGMVFIAAEDSPNGAPLLVTANEETGTMAIYAIQ